MMDDREQQIKNMIVAQIAKFASQLGDRKVFLFGSRVSGGAKERSDFDVGVYGDSPLPLKEFFTIEDALDALPTLYKIDWVDLNQVASKFREEAMKNIEILYG